MKRRTPASPPVWTWFHILPTYGKFAFTDDKVLLTLLPRPFSTKIATTAMRARISAYSTKLWPFRDFSPRYIFRRVLFISFTSFIWLFRIAQRSNRLTLYRKNSRSLRATFILYPSISLRLMPPHIHKPLPLNPLTRATNKRCQKE